MTAQPNAPARVDVVMLATPEIEYYARHTKADWQDYCDRHGYRFKVYDRKTIADMHINWTRIEMGLNERLASDADWVCVVDADSWVADKDVSLAEFARQSGDRDVMFASDVGIWAGIPFPLNPMAVRLCRTLRPPCAGFFFLKNTDFARRFPAMWLDLARGKLAHLADRHPRNQLVLWTGLFRQNRAHIGLLGHGLARVTSEVHFRNLKLAGPRLFIAHDKRVVAKDQTVFGA